MDAWWQCEVPYPFVPQEILNATDSVRASLPNRYCDPKVAADLFDVVAKGAVKIEVNQTFPLKDAPAAHIALESRKTTGSTVLLP